MNLEGHYFYDDTLVWPVSGGVISSGHEVHFAGPNVNTYNQGLQAYSYYSTQYFGINADRFVVCHMAELVQMSAQLWVSSLGCADLK